MRLRARGRIWIKNIGWWVKILMGKPKGQPTYWMAALNGRKADRLCSLSPPDSKILDRNIQSEL